MKIIDAYVEKLVKVPSEYHYVCDTCGHVFKKGERKVTQHSKDGVEHACYTRPCSPFSKPKGYESVWSAEEQRYIWKEVK